jgi:hypothetical protein
MSRKQGTGGSARREESVFHGALEQSTPPARKAYLDRACGKDADLRRRVESLLQAAESANRFMEHPDSGAPMEDKE